MKVTVDFFQRVTQWFHQAHPGTSTVCSDDFFYNVKGVSVRTSRTTTPHEVCLQHVQKVCLAAEDVSIAPVYGEGEHVKGTDFCDVRVALNEEKSAPSNLPFGVDVQFIRRKERASFEFHKFWRLDATKSYSGKTLEEVELKQQRGECAYELEIECTDLNAMLSEKTDEYIAEDAMLKSTALFRSGSFVAVRGGKNK